ncbi:Protein-tyrosine sulfotransferase [Vitis vinifera]|uniref:Protein-tyrosine sulfotransferase n=1 Tax=Vitis vinifera TaxID=29760 RepID=A0A438IKF4_VITVI|nr:Protein-tyrosine sulfotransferase [Vitis vinifera]
MAVHHVRVFWSFNCLEKSSIARQLKPSVRAQCINNPTAHIIKTQATELFYSFAPAEPLAFVSVVVGGSLGFLGHTEWPRKSRIVFPGIFGSVGAIYEHEIPKIGTGSGQSRQEIDGPCPEICHVVNPSWMGLVNASPAKHDFGHCERTVKKWASSSLDLEVKEDKHTLQDLLFFLHVPRTGGRTYFHCFLKRLYPSSLECPRSYDKLRFDPSKPNCRLLVTHDDYSMMSKLPREKTSVVTILRNPLDRVFSAYEFSVEVAARFLVHPNLTSAKQMALRIRSKTKGVSTLDIWPWKYLVPWMRDDLFARRDARKDKGPNYVKGNDSYNMEEIVMPLHEYINDPIARDIIHNGATFQVGNSFGKERTNSIGEDGELTRVGSRVRLKGQSGLRLEHIQRGFLWGGGTLEQKPHLIRGCFWVLWWWVKTLHYDTLAGQDFGVAKWQIGVMEMEVVMVALACNALWWESPSLIIDIGNKGEIWDRRSVSSVWKVKVWIGLLFLLVGASRGIVILWDSVKFNCGVEEGLLDGASRPTWSDFPKVVCRRGFNVIRRISEKMGDSRLTVNMRCFDEFIRESGLLDPPLGMRLLHGSNMHVNPICKRRLRKVLHETIFGSQGAFVEGRQILDAVLIANEDEKRRSGEEGVVFKIDFEKAYDHVDWGFLDHVLQRKGFSQKWRSWMRGCLSSSSFAILVNGNAKGWVKASRGLRQGDPLSHFLFTLVADVLSRLMIRAEETGITEGFLVGRDRTRVSLLQFADDTIFFSKASLDLLQNLKIILLVFGQESGLKINLEKSTISGLPLGGNPKTIGFWDPVSCLSHIPSYFLSLFKIPVSIASKIEKMQRDFLWSGAGEGKRDHLIRWEVVSRPREMGGLGFGKTSMRNSALLGKWLWSS